MSRNAKKNFTIRGPSSPRYFERFSFLLTFVWRVVHPFRFWIGVLTTISFIWAIYTSLRPYVIKLLLDSIGNHAPIEQTFQLALHYIVLIAVAMVVFRVYDLAWLKLNSPLKRHTGLLLMNRMMRHAHPFYQENASGNQGAKIHDIMRSLPDIIQLVVDPFFGHFTALAIGIFTVWTVHIKLALALSIWCILFVAYAFFISKKAQPLGRQYAERRASVLGTLVDMLTNMLNVRFFTGRPQERNVLQGKLSEMVDAAQARDWFLLKIFNIQSLFFLLYQMVCMWLLLSEFKKGNVTVGDFALLLTLNTSMLDCMWSLTKDFSRFSDLWATLTQGLSLVYRPLEIQDRKNAVPLKVKSGEIAFHNVRFRYGGAEPLFENNSITIHPKQKVGLVGYSGGGKTTFINLILRLFDIQSGVIAIDGQDIRSVTQDSLRAHIGVIPQNPVLFHRTLMENIRYGRHDASDEDVIAAAKKAQAHAFIKKMPERYESMVGERGLRLSGGQRQRIAIARAILKNAPILILDEATSELDSLTEAEIQNALKALMKGKTALVVAHRLSTLLSMDRILVFDAGNIVEDGTHASLLLKEGDTLYKKLWSKQVGDYLPQKEM